MSRYKRERPSSFLVVLRNSKGVETALIAALDAAAAAVQKCGAMDEDIGNEPEPGASDRPDGIKCDAQHPGNFIKTYMVIRFVH